MRQLVTAACLLVAGCAKFPPRKFGAADAGGMNISEGEGEGSDAGNPPEGEGEGEGPAGEGEGEGEGPVGEGEGEGEGPAGEGEGEGEGGPIAGEGEGEGPVGEGEGEGPVGEGEGEGPAGEGEGEGEGEGQTGEGEGEGPVGEGEGEGPVGEGEGEGEGEAPCLDEDCAHLTDACNTGVCDPLATPGEDDPCMAEPVENGNPCEDGLFCTDFGFCSDGLCTSVERDCILAGNGICVSGVCDENTRACVADEDVLDGEACPVQGGQCVRGECRSGECRVLSAEEGTPCVDGNRCTEADRCRDDGECRGTPVSCAHLSTECATGECNPGTGECRAVPQPDDTDCDDDRFCTVNDECQSGQCVGADRDCSIAGNGVCIRGVCDEETNGCIADATIENGSPCDDNSRCTGDGACLDGACQPGAALDCSHLTDQCNVGVCDPQAPAGDPCVAQAVENNTPCTDLDDACTLGDTCQNGACVPGPAPDADGDGHVTDACGGGDCDDGEETVNPDADELCDGLDNDCDGETDLFYEAAPGWMGWNGRDFARVWSPAAGGCRTATLNNSYYFSPAVTYPACRVEVCVNLADLGGVHVYAHNPGLDLMYDDWYLDSGGKTCHTLPANVPTTVTFKVVTNEDMERIMCSFNVRGVFEE